MVLALGYGPSWRLAWQVQPVLYSATGPSHNFKTSAMQCDASCT